MTLIQAIMSRDDCSYEDAIDLIHQMAEEVSEGSDPEDVLYEEGFEPDYIPDLLDYC